MDKVIHSLYNRALDVQVYVKTLVKNDVTFDLVLNSPKFTNSYYLFITFGRILIFIQSHVIIALDSSTMLLNNYAFSLH